MLKGVLAGHAVFLGKASGALTLAIFFSIQADQQFHNCGKPDRSHWWLHLSAHTITPPSLANLIFNPSHCSDRLHV